MAVIRLPQNSFANGIIVEDRLRGRYELKQYLAGARELHNVASHPQGGVVRRMGTIWMHRYTDQGPDFKFVKFDYSDAIAYLLVFYDDNIDVWKNNVLVHTITGTGITATQLTQMDFVQRANGLILVHDTLAPHQLSRGANDVTWTLAPCTFINMPLFGFSIVTTNPSSTTNPAATLTPNATTGVNVGITTSAGVLAAGDVGKYIFSGNSIAKVVSYVTATTALVDIIKQFTSTGAIASGSWSLDAGAIEPSAISGNIRIKAGGNVFNATDVGGYVSGNGGEARITEYVSAKEVTARVTLNFVDTSPIPSGSWELENGYSDAWTSGKGYPRSVAYDNDSLIFGGTRSLPDVFWKSAIGNYFEFDDTKAQADGAMTTNVPADEINDIRFIVSGNDLLIMTSEAEFYVDGDLTPELNFKIRKQEKRGCRQFVKPVFVDGAPIYIDSKADVLRELTYSDVDAKYSSTNLTLFCPGLLDNPHVLAHQKPFGKRDNDYVWIVNEGGDWVIFNTLRRQDINGFTTGRSREDELITCEDLNGMLYAMFKRSIDGNDEYYLERFSPDVTMDCCKVYSGAATDTIEDVDFLEGEDVKILTNGYVYGEETVVGGEVELTKEYTDYVIGFPFIPRIVTLPPPVNLPDGTAIGQVRRVAAVSIGCSNTGEFTVNGQPVRTRRFGQEIFDAPPPLIDGRKRVTLRGGYNRDPVVTIEQIEPLTFHITDLILEIQV